MPKANIVSGEVTFVSYIEPNSAFDAAVWRASLAGVAPMFQPTITLNAALNKAKTNVNVSGAVNYPVVRIVDNRQVSTDAIRGSFAFTSLQSASDLDDEKLVVLDALIALISAEKQNIINGKTK